MDKIKITLDGKEVSVTREELKDAIDMFKYKEGSLTVDKGDLYLKHYGAITGRILNKHADMTYVVEDIARTMAKLMDDSLTVAERMSPDVSGYTFTIAVSSVNTEPYNGHFNSGLVGTQNKVFKTQETRDKAFKLLKESTYVNELIEYLQKDKIHIGLAGGE